MRSWEPPGVGGFFTLILRALFLRNEKRVFSPKTLGGQLESGPEKVSRLCVSEQSILGPPAEEFFFHREKEAFFDTPLVLNNTGLFGVFPTLRKFSGFWGCCQTEFLDVGTQGFSKHTEDYP